MQKKIEKIFLFAFSVVLASCSSSQSIENSFLYEKLGDNIYLKSSKDGDYKEIVDTYAGEDYISKNNINFSSLDFLTTHLSEQSIKKNCDDIFYFFVPYGTGSIYESNDNKFLYCYDEVKTVGGEEIYTNPIVYYSFYLDEIKSGKSHIYGFFLPTVDKESSINIIAKSYNNTMNNVVVSSNGLIISSIFYHKDLTEIDQMKAVVKYYSFFTDFIYDRTTYEDMYSIKENKEIIQSGEIADTISIKTNQHFAYLKSSDSLNRFAYNLDANNQLLDPVLYQYKSVNRQAISGDNFIEKCLNLINNGPIIYNISAFFFANKTVIENVRYDINIIIGVINKVNMYSHDVLVGVAYITTSIQLMNFDIIIDYLNNTIEYL